MHSIGYSSTKTRFRLAQNRTALFLCRFRRRTFAEHTNVDYGAGTDGSHGRPLCQRCTAGTHSRHRSGSDRLEKHPFRICQYRLLGNSGIADDTPRRATGRHHPPGMPMPQDTNRQHKYTSASQGRRAFLFFHWIFIHPSSHTEEEFNEILTHEQTHARQWHSIDVIISELVCIFCWCNPFAWLMKREIRTNLEYMADARVLENGYDSKTYQYHLLGLSHQKAAATIYNSFNVLPLKNASR